MGYVWVPTKNMLHKGTVHTAFRDDANSENQGQVVFLCEMERPRFRRRKSMQRTSKKITCMLCINAESG